MRFPTLVLMRGSILPAGLFRMRFSRRKLLRESLQPSWVTDLLLTPVLMEIHGTVDRFLWEISVPGGLFYVADATNPASDEEIIQFKPGMLIRLLLPGKHCRACHALSEKMSSVCEETGRFLYWPSSQKLLKQPASSSWVPEIWESP